MFYANPTTTYFIKRKKYQDQILEDIDDAEKVISKSGNVNFKSFDLHDKLNDQIWDKNDNLDHDVREDLINIAGDFYDTLDIAEITGEEDKITDTGKDKTFLKYVKDVLFVGSLASFNYSSYADIDLHLLMDENLLVGNNKLALNILKKYFTECKNDWNLKHSDLKIKGYDVELYVQDVNEVNASNGVYSLMNDEWVKQPQKLETANFDRAWVEKKALGYIEQIDALEEIIRSQSDLELIEKSKDELKKIKDKIIQGRRDSLAAGQGEMNSYNILFKILRRSGHIGKINDLTLAAYDMLNSIDNKQNLKKEKSNDMNINAFGKDENGNDIDWQGQVVEPVTESDADAIEEFEDMYGPNASKALKAYLSKRTKKTAEQVLNDDDEFDKFANWAFKHLKIDVYAKFAKYDTGSFYKRTSDLVRDPEQRGDKRYSSVGDDTRYSYDDEGDLGGFDKNDTIDWDKQFPDTPEDDFQESIIVKEDGEYVSREMEIRNILNTKWTDPRDIDVEDEPYQYRFIISVEVDKVARFLDKALREYALSKDKEEFMNKMYYVANTYCSIEVPDEIIENYGNRIMSLVDVKGESITVVEDDNNQNANNDNNKETSDNQKTVMVLGKLDDMTTAIILNSEPDDDCKKILNNYNNFTKELYKKSNNGSDNGYKNLEWKKDGEFWYLAIPKKVSDVKSELESAYGQKYQIEVKESTVKEDNLPPAPGNQSTDQNNQQSNNANKTQQPATNNQPEQQQTNNQNQQKPEDQNNTNNQQPQQDGQQQTTESEDTPKITGTSWEEFLKNVEEQSIYKVDSAFKRHPNQWVELIDDTGKIYDGEVTSYSDGAFELLYSNIHPVPNAEESKKKTPINESYADDAIDNIKDVLKRYFEVDPETEEENPEFDENFTAQDAIDEIVEILY